MADPPMLWMLAYCGVGKFTETLLPELVTLEMFRPCRLMAGYFLISLKVKTTSAGVNGVPSFHLTPWRMVNVIVLPPLDQAYFVASHG